MAYYFMTASKDATIYLQQPNQNTGLDEMLEISKIYYGTVKDVSRALLKFDVGHLSKSLSDGSVKMKNAYLVLKETESEEIPLDYTLYAYAVSGSWNMGKGTRFDEISTSGVTWKYRESDTRAEWLENSLAGGTTSNPNDGTGGTWYINNAASQSFNYSTADISMDVTDMLKAWMSGSINGGIPNDGLMVKFANDKENDVNDYGIIKLFSKETHTIFQPKIIIGWDDQSYLTGSLSELSSDNIKVGITNLKKEYKVNTTISMRVFAREMYPLKTFTNSFGYNTIKYLPKNSYYQIRDFASNDIIVPFSDYSKLNCDSNGNYITINFTNWESDRVYKIEFKIDGVNGSQYIDTELTFSVVKN
jgi:hypothetical protein